MNVADAFDRNLFWDVNPDKLDWKKNQLFIIERVFVRGGMNSIKTLMKAYSKSQIIETLKRAKDLDAVTHNFCSNYFHIPKSEMNAPSQYH